MTGLNHSTNEAFDFSLEALEFRDALWQKLKVMMASTVQELDDDDLSCLNAAGNPFRMELPGDEAP